MANSLEIKLDAAGNIGRRLEYIGGILRCTVCGRTEALGDIAEHLRHGWPKCHNLTMRWVTQRELGEGKFGG